jgi:putative ABC transport system permease protein
VLLAFIGAGVLWFSGLSIAWSYLGILAIILAFACWIPPVVLMGARALRPLLGYAFGIMGRMAASGIEQSLSRSAVAVAALTIAVAATSGVGIMVDSFRTTVNTWLTYSLEADIYISPPGDVFRRNDATITAEAEILVRNNPGVDSAFSVRTARVLINDWETDLIVTEPRPQELEPGRYKHIMSGDHREAMQNRDVVMVSEPYAFRYGTNVGDSLRIMTSHGPTDFLVGAVYYDYASDLGAVQMTRNRYDVHFDDPRASGLAIYASSGVDLDSLIQKLRADTAPVQSLNIRSNRDLLQASLDVFDQTFTVTTVLRLLAILVAFVGVLTALMALQLERSRELAVLRANGMTPGQVGRMITLQTSSMGLLAGLLSVPLGLVLAWLLIYVINQRSFGWTLQFEADGTILLQAILLAVVAAALAAIYPSLSMSRTKASEALREE